MKEFNINDYFYVKFTDYGYDIWLNRENKYPGLTTSIKKLKEKEDEDGYVKIQSWCFMEQFGSYIRMGGENIIENNIILFSEKDLKNHISSVKMIRRKKLERLIKKYYNQK